MRKTMSPSARRPRNRTHGRASYASFPHSSPNGGISLDASATFDTFVPGDSNRFARTIALATALSAAEETDCTFTPLCILSRPGLGKTHLLNAIGNYALAHNPDLTINYVPLQHFIDNNRNTQMCHTLFDTMCQKSDLLLVDDAHLLPGVLFDTDTVRRCAATLTDQTRKVIITSDLASLNSLCKYWPQGTFIERVLPAIIEPPTMETRMAVLHLILATSGCIAPDSVLIALAEQFPDNIRKMKNTFMVVIAVARETGLPITTDLAQRVIRSSQAMPSRAAPHGKGTTISSAMMQTACSTEYPPVSLEHSSTHPVWEVVL